MDDQLNKIYELINQNDLIYDAIDRETMRDIINKMIEICDYYYIHYSGLTLENNNHRQKFENNILCYRIRNNKKCDEPATRDTILSLLGVVWAFIYYYHESSDKIFNDNIFMNTVGLCAVFKFKNKKVNKRDEFYYKCLNIPDGQPFTPKHYFFNDGTLTEKIKEFLNYNLHT